MIKVVFQDRGYWLSEEFWQEAELSGHSASLVQSVDRQQFVQPITKAEFAKLFQGRVAS